MACSGCGCDPCNCLDTTVQRGATGATGAGWRSGAGAPTFQLGDILNTHYLNLTNGDIWRYSGTAWVNTGTNIFGADGAAGLLLKHNNRTAVSTTGVILQDLKSYPLTSGLLAPNDSIIEIETLFTVTPNANAKICNVLFDVNTIGSLTLSGFTQASLRFNFKFSRLSATTVQRDSTLTVYDSSGNMEFTRSVLNTAPMTVQNLDSLSNIIKTQGDGIVAGDITCEFLTVEIKPLV